MQIEDNKVREIIKDSMLELPFTDFEDRMMAKISRYEAQKRQALQHRFYSLLFFFIGTIFGLALNYIVGQNLQWLSSSSQIQERLSLGINIIYIVLIILISDRFWKLYKAKYT